MVVGENDVGMCLIVHGLSAPSLLAALITSQPQPRSSVAMPSSCGCSLRRERWNLVDHKPVFEAGAPPERRGFELEAALRMSIPARPRVYCNWHLSTRQIRSTIERPRPAANSGPCSSPLELLKISLCLENTSVVSTGRGPNHSSGVRRGVRPRSCT